MNTKKTLLGSALVLYFVIAFEVLIMISPFAGFFYSIFNPVLLKLAGHPSTRWLSAFYLPHMVLPQDPFLQFVRIMGSVLFVLGILVFFICAAQIYAAKFRKKGPVLGGFYSYIRHPQYLSLGIAGLGLSILWPRFLTVVLWLLMAFVYYFLAKDEERRMLKTDPETYKAYMNKTGMFLPKKIERAVTPFSTIGRVAFVSGLVAVVIGGAFLLRAYAINQLTLWTKAENVTAIAILPEDGFKMEHRMADILNLPEVRSKMKGDTRYLVYFLPRDYVMQGMIADTGEDWRLYKHHHSVSMITDWIFHPFRHLSEEHHAMHSHRSTVEDNGVVRRLIFLSISPCCSIKISKPFDIFSKNMLRTPEFMIDVDVHNMRLLGIKDLAHGSGWGTVPTPMF